MRREAVHIRKSRVRLKRPHGNYSSPAKTRARRANLATFPNCTGDSHGFALRHCTVRCQNWLITPAVPPNAQTNTQTWQVVLSGVAVLKTTANATGYTIIINPDVTGPINWAIANYGAPKLPVGSVPCLQLEQWAPYAAVGSIFDEAQSTDAGFDVNTWRPNPFLMIKDVATGLEFNQIFTGMQVDITARQTGTMIFRLPYNITLIARIASYLNPIQ